MNKRLQKKIIIAVVFFLAVGTVAFLIYKSLLPVPSCFDNIQNQTEEGVDCGGLCEACKPEIKDIQALWTDILSGSTKAEYVVVSRLRNPNTEYGAETISYDLVFYDGDDNIISTLVRESFVLPGEIKYIIEPRANLDRRAEKAEIQIKSTNWQKLRDYQDPRLDIGSKLYRILGESDPGSSKVSGIVTNRTNFDFDKVLVNIVLFDKKNSVIGANITQLRTLLALEERYFEATWFWQMGDVQNVVIEAETNLFLQENFIRRHGTQEEFQTY